MTPGIITSRNALVKRRRQQVAGGDDAGQPIVLVQHGIHALLRADATARMAAWASEMICVVRRTTVLEAHHGRTGSCKLPAFNVWRTSIVYRRSSRRRLSSHLRLAPKWRGAHNLPQPTPFRLGAIPFTVSPVTVLITEDFAPFREFVCRELQRRPGFELVTVADGRAAVQKAEELRPAVILLDIGLPELDGLTAPGTFARAVPNPASCS